MRSYRDFDGINGEPTEFEWNIFPGFTTLQLCGKINDLLSDLGQKPETFTVRIIFMSMFKGQPDQLSSTDLSKEDYDRARSSQKWKSEVTAHDRSKQLD